MIRRAGRSQIGMTQVEMMATVAIISVLTIALGSMVYSVLRHAGRSGAHVTAASAIEEAARWVAHDGQMAQMVNLIPGAEPVSALVLTWIDPVTGDSFEVDYFLSGTDFRRREIVNSVLQGESTEASHISQVWFSQSAYAARLFKVSFTASALNAQVNESKEYYVALRAVG